MKIQQDYQYVKGEHKGIDFEYKESKLIMFNNVWSEDEVKKLVEVVTLLKAHGYELKKQIFRKKRLVENMWGETYPVYDEVSEEESDEPEGR